MGYNYNYYYYHSSYRSLLMNPIDPFKGTLNIPYYYHSSIPYKPKVGFGFRAAVWGRALGLSCRARFGRV